MRFQKKERITNQFLHCGRYFIIYPFFVLYNNIIFSLLDALESDLDYNSYRMNSDDLVGKLIRNSSCFTRS